MPPKPLQRSAGGFEFADIIEAKTMSKISSMLEPRPSTAKTNTYANFSGSMTKMMIGGRKNRLGLGLSSSSNTDTPSSSFTKQ